MTLYSSETFHFICYCRGGEGQSRGQAGGCRGWKVRGCPDRSPHQGNNNFNTIIWKFPLLRIPTIIAWLRFEFSKLLAPDPTQCNCFLLNIGTKPVTKIITTQDNFEQSLVFMIFIKIIIFKTWTFHENGYNFSRSLVLSNSDSAEVFWAKKG